jgi:hypothetical protein
LFIIVLGLEPAVAIGTALVTEVFGFASGVVGHWRKRTIDWKVVRLLAVASVPAAIVGSLIGGQMPETLLKGILAVGLTLIAFTFVRHHDPKEEDEEIEMGIDVVEPAVQRRLIAADNQVYEYQLCRQTEGRAFAGVGGLFVGMISTGLGEANSYTLVKRCRIPSRVAVAVSVTTVAITALVASITHLLEFVRTPDAPTGEILAIVAFTIPGVIIGGQIGPKLVGSVSEQRLIRSLGWLFFFIAGVTIIEAVFG